MLDEDIEVHDHDTRDQGEYRGHAGYGRSLKDWGAAWADWTMEPEEYIDARDQAAVGVPHEGDWPGCAPCLNGALHDVYATDPARVAHARLTASRGCPPAPP
jgi:hypothetical protein